MVSGEQVHPEDVDAWRAWLAERAAAEEIAYPTSEDQDGAVAAPWVLDEDDALELLAYLVTAARTQVDEAAEYGPMRLLTAAHRLAETMGPRASPETAEALAGPLDEMPLLAVPRDRGRYVEQLDDVCRSLAKHLGERYAR